MDLNTQHSVWSLWTFTVHPEHRVELDFEVIRVNCARFGRKVFGSAAQMCVETERWDTGTACVVKVRAEGHPAQDPQYVGYVAELWARFFKNGFGQGSRITHEVKWEAGDRGDGRPPDQLVILPRIEVNLN